MLDTLGLRMQPHNQAFHVRNQFRTWHQTHISGSHAHTVTVCAWLRLKLWPLQFAFCKSGRPRIFFSVAMKMSCDVFGGCMRMIHMSNSLASQLLVYFIFVGSALSRPGHEHAAERPESSE